MSGELVLVMGVPGSGKTTWAGMIHEEQHGKKTYLASDDIRVELYGDVTHMAGNSVVFDVLEDRAMTALKDGHVVTVDATFSRGPFRRDFLNKFRNVANFITGYVMMTPLDECLMRNRTRERVVPDGVILEFHRLLLEDPPSLHEGFTELRSISPELASDSLYFIRGNKS